MNGDRLMYFQHTDISRVVFEGYVDDDEIMMCDNIVNAMEKTEIERADVRKLKRSMVNWYGKNRPDNKWKWQKTGRLY